MNKYLTQQPILLEKFLAAPPPAVCGAVVTFTGVVRNHHNGRGVRRIFYSCYEAMAEKEIEKIIQEVRSEWPVEEIRLIHRVGRLEIGDAAVAIWVSAAHREEAFGACRDIIEAVKRRVPIWKKEEYEDGSSEWVMGCSHAMETLP